MASNQVQGELQGKYEELIPLLHARRADLRHARGRMGWLLAAGVVTAPIGWAFGLTAFVSVVTLFLVLWGTGVYIATMYDWAYERQIADARSEIARLEAGPERGGESVAPEPDRWRASRVPRRAFWTPWSS